MLGGLHREGEGAECRIYSYSTTVMCVCVLSRAHDAIETGRLFLNHLSLLGIETVKVSIHVYS